MNQMFFPAFPWDVLMRQIFEMIYYGGLTYSDVMKMPIYQRNRLHAFIIETKNKENQNYSIPGQGGRGH